MKKLISVLIILSAALVLFSCAAKDSAEQQMHYDSAPKIVIDGKDYFAPDLDIVTELPDGYEYVGELTAEQLRYADIYGCKYYAKTDSEVLTDFYVYQECGTRISDSVVDSTKRQWAYVRWSLADSAH